MHTDIRPGNSTATASIPQNDYHDSLLQEASSPYIRRLLIDEAYKSKNDLGIALAVIKTKIEGNLAQRQEIVEMSIAGHFLNLIGIDIRKEYFNTRL